MSRMYYFVVVCVVDVMNLVFGVIVKGIFVGVCKCGYMVVFIDFNELFEIEFEIMK